MNHLLHPENDGFQYRNLLFQVLILGGAAFGGPLRECLAAKTLDFENHWVDLCKKKGNLGKMVLFMGNPLEG